MEKCKHCQRERPDYVTDPSCEKGGYCDWEESLEVKVTQLGGSKVTPMDVSWITGNGTAGFRMTWSFPNTAIVEGLEVEPLRPSNMPPWHRGSYNGFIDALRIGNCDYLHIAPYPILMWSPGRPPVQLWIPSVPIGNHFSLEVRDFRGKIRPRGLVLNP